MKTKTTKILKITLWAIITIVGLIFINNYKADALTIADQNNVPSACPSNYPNNTGHCTVFIDSITVNGFIDNDTSDTVKNIPIPYGYLIPGQTINISWTDNTSGWNDPNGTSINNYLIKYGCGNDINLSNDTYTIGTTVGKKYISWTVPSSVANYQYCKIWVYAKGIEPNYQPTLGVSNTRAFKMQPPPQNCSITNFSANDYSINKGDNITLNWNTTNCNSCTASASPSNSYWSGNQTIYGSKTIYDLQDSTTFTLTCSGSANTDTKQVTVTVQTPPPPVTRYSCNTSTWTCYQNTYGSYASYNDCALACQPPVTRYTCTSNYQCVPASNGEYGSLSTCQNNCVPPPITRYSCNTSTWTCYQNTYGSYASYNDCALACQPPNISLSFWADDYTLNSGDSTYLRWAASNANYCVASNGWSGNKSLASYELVTPQNQTTYTLTCYGNGTQITKSVTIYVASPSATLTFTKLGRNLTNGDPAYMKTIRVNQGDIVEFYLTVTAGNTDLNNVIVKENLPSVLSYKNGTTKLNGVIQADTITTSGLALGTIPKNTSKTIIFQAVSNNPGSSFVYTNTAQVTASDIGPISDSATIIFTSVLGAATVETGAEDSLLISAILSIVLAFFMWYYIQFNPQGKLAFAKLENKIRDLRLAYWRKHLKR